MLNNWFNKSDDNQAKQPLDGPSHASTIDISRPSADLVDEKPGQRATTLSTPHDAILAKLQGRRPETAMQPKEIGDTEESPPRLNNPYPGRADLSSTSQPLFDPFTGTHVGDLLAGEDKQDPDSNTEEDLWAHLSKILKLQSDIAEMHIKMEGIGLKKPGPAPNKSKGGVNRRPSTSEGREWGEGAADEGVDEEADEEAENKRKREEEFSRLTGKFTGRRDAIDGIMKNLDELSSALGTFHALRAPIIDFQNKSGSASTSTSQPIGSASQPTPVPIPPNESLSTPPAAVSSPGTHKRQRLSKVLPLLDEASSPIVDSPDSIIAALPDEHAP